MPCIALNQPGGMGDFIDPSGNVFPEGIDPFAVLTDTTVSPPSSQIQLTTVKPAPSIWDSIVGVFTSKPVVNAAVNRFIFGSPTGYPTTTQYAVPPVQPQFISGIPNAYLMLGAAAALFMVMKPGRGRR